MAKTYNVGVIGYGMSAKVFHIPLILTTPSMKLHSIVQRTPKPNDSAASDHPTAKIYNSADAMFADADIDIIVVTTTPDTHFNFTAAALKAGKHVIVEKPFVPTSSQADELVALSKSTGKFIVVYQNRRWDSDFLTFRKLQSEGTLGCIVEFETHFDRYKPERPTTWKGELLMDQAGGVIYDLGTHLIDQVYVAFGMPSGVIGFFANQRGDHGVEPDSVTAILRYDGGEHKGLIATVKACVMSVEVEQPRYWVRGSKGSFKKCHLDVQEDQLKAGMKPGDEGFGIESSESSGTLTVLENGSPKISKFPNVTPQTYGALYQGFVDALDKGDESLVPVKASQASDVLKIIEAIRESAKSGKIVNL